MIAVTYKDTKTNSGIIKEIYELEMVREINQHTTLKMTALVHEHEEDQYIKEINA